MNKALEVLYNEHEIIKSVINYGDKLNALVISDPSEYKKVVTELIGFFRNYADKFHHYKEEKLLFPLICEKNELLKDSIVSELLDNHRDFRDMVIRIEQDVNKGNFKDANSLLLKYTEMLLDHIAVEDDELFQMAETLLDDKELEKMNGDFEDIDRELGLDLKSSYELMGENTDLQ